MSEINRAAYEQLIREDLAMLAEMMPKSCLERRHIEQVLRWSIDAQYVEIRDLRQRLEEVEKRCNGAIHWANASKRIDTLEQELAEARRQREEAEAKVREFETQRILRLATMEEMCTDNAKLREALLIVDQHFARDHASGNWMGDEEHETWRVVKSALAEKPTE
jgi:DNA repair exonuclease SbcCD ATPase subunit